MIDELTRYHEILGVSVGASSVDLKTAHRDLAKVWHPDRFGHDPRLQAKAQEKLKEINEAYDKLVSGTAKRFVPIPTPNKNRAARPERNYSTNPDDTAASAPPTETPATRNGKWPLVLVATLVFGFGFFFTARALFSRAQPQPDSAVAQSRPQTSAVAEAKRTETAKVNALTGPKPVSNTNPRTAGSDPSATREQTLPAQTVKTETVLIDSTTGLLARSDCPVKTRMTYVNGAEPRQYCSAAHATPAPKDSKIQSAIKRIKSPSRWFGGKKRESTDKP